MIFPKGEVVHQNLSTEYTDVPDLLSSLTSNGFAGIVEVEFPQERGAFFIKEGQVLSAVIESGPDQITTFGQEAKDELLHAASKEVGTLSIYKLSPTQINAIVSRFCSEIVFKGLTTDFVKIDKFIQKLGNEHHTGFIEVFTKKNEIMGTIFLQEGKLAGLQLPHESENPSSPLHHTIPIFLEDVIRQGAVFDVYRSLLEKVPSVTPQPEAVHEPNIESRSDNIIKAEEETLVDEISTEEEDLDHNNEVFEEPNANGRGNALRVLQEVIIKTEGFVDGFSQEGIFLRAFKRALIEKSELYPFLDPFSDQFDYRKGLITLDEEVELEHFAIGIADCFNLTLSHLKKEFPKNMNLSQNIKKELESKFELYRDAMKQSGVQSVPLFFFK